MPEAEEKHRRPPWWPLGSVIHWIGRRERFTLVALVALCGAAWGLAELTDEVLEGSTQSVDRSILLALRSAEDPDDPIGPAWVAEMARDATALGGVLVALLTTLGGTALLCFHGKLRQACYLLGSVGLGLGLSTVFKSVVDRARPDLVPHGSHVTSASFPSGHSMMSAIIYFTIAALLIRAEERTRIKAFLLLSAVFVCGLIGVSRVYLGVHWPTDVLGGWTAGAAWALLSHQLATWLKIHDHPPSSPETAPSA